jgi:hypothetical protein
VRERMNRRQRRELVWLIVCTVVGGFALVGLEDFFRYLGGY